MANQNVKNFPRYEDYKDSGVDWIGEIPEHWEIERAKWLFLKMERAVRPEDEIVTCFRDGEVTLRKNRRTDGFTNAALEHGYQGIRKNDLVIHAMDAFAGAIGISDSDGKSTPVYSACIPRIKNKVEVRFYAYYLRHLALTGFIQSLARGIRERSTDFRFSDFSELSLPFPPLPEQTAIAQFLDHKTAQIDRAIAIKEEQIKLLNERKQIMIQEAVTKGLDPTVPMKDSGVEWIGEIPEHWEVKKIKFLTSKVGSGITPRGGAVTYLSEGIPLLRSQNIFFNKIEFNNVVHISSFTHNEMKNSQVHFGDVLLNITGGSIGRCYFVDVKKEINVNQHVCIIRPIKSEILTKYLHMLFTSKMGQDQIWSCQQGGGREGLNFNAINNFLFPIPQLDTQKKIMAKLENLNHQTEANIKLYHNQIKALKEYKTTLINEAVTGKIKVN